jgi:serine/threonine protein kinase
MDQVIPSEILNLIKINQAYSCTSKPSSIVKLLEVYEEEEYVHLVMEYCPGGALGELFQSDEHDSDQDSDHQNNSQCSLEESTHKEMGERLSNEMSIKRIMRKLLYAVKFLHDTGIAHRDLKLDNIMLVRKTECAIETADIKIVDFGLSAEFDVDEFSSEKFKQLVGTPHYLAPEVLNHAYDEKCDIWALGVIAFKLFMKGQNPFEGDSEPRIYKAIKKNKINFSVNSDSKTRMSTES